MVNRNRFAWKGDTCCCRGALFHLNLFVESQHQPQPAGHFVTKSTTNINKVISSTNETSQITIDGHS